MKNNKQTKQIEENVSEKIGTEKDTSDKKVEEKKKMSRKKKLIIILASVIVGLVVISVLVWLFFFKAPSFTGQNVMFELEGPIESIAGETTTYKINYANNENVELEDVEISIIYPDGFIFKSCDPKSKSFNDNKWNIGTLNPGDNGSIIIKGDLYGEVGSSLTTVANLAYKPKNVSSSFNQSSEFATKINASEIEMQVDIIESVQKDKEFEYNIKLNNSTDFDINNIRIESIFPDNFEFLSSQPNTKSSYFWDFPKIAAGEDQEIKVVGKISGEVGDEREIKTRLGLFDAHNNFYLQREELNKISLVNISGDLKILVNGQEETAKSPGDILEYTVFYNNTGSERLRSNKITLSLDGIKYLDPSSVIIDQGELVDNKVIWDYEKIDKLKDIEPGQEGTFVFKINIANPLLIENIDEKNISINAKVAQQAKRGDTDDEISIESSETVVKINSEVGLSAEVRYYDQEGKEVGTGPLPPKVGEKTTYRIYLTLSNRSNDIDNGRVELTLSDIASWESNKEISVGDLKFEGGKIIWEIGKIPANTGQFANQMTAEFDVSITPNNEDAGKVVDIINEITTSGIDSFTSSSINNVQEGLNTDLTRDFLAQGKEEVSN